MVVMLVGAMLPTILGSSAQAADACVPEGSPSESVEGVTHAPITFVNQTDIDVLVYWLNYSGEREFWFSLAPGESHFENTWLTHPWVVVDDTDRCLGYVLADEPDGKTFDIQLPQTLTVTVDGQGSVTSEPGGISCPPSCTYDFLFGTSVGLLASPGAGEGFTGWSGDCTGDAECDVVMDAPRSVSGTFEAGTTNHAPIASDMTVNTNVDTPVVFALLASDPDGDSLQFNIESQPLHGQLDGAFASALTYWPNDGFQGTDSFTFTVSDGNSTSNVATVTIQVEPAAGAEAGLMADNIKKTFKCGNVTCLRLRVGFSDRRTKINASEVDLDGFGTGNSTSLTSGVQLVSVCLGNVWEISTKRNIGSTAVFFPTDDITSTIQQEILIDSRHRMFRYTECQDSNALTGRIRVPSAGKYTLSAAALQDGGTGAGIKTFSHKVTLTVSFTLQGVQYTARANASGKLSI